MRGNRSPYPLISVIAGYIFVKYEIKGSNINVTLVS
jgi:hypothetical protein